jgi:hypothetical protein
MFLDSASTTVREIRVADHSGISRSITTVAGGRLDSAGSTLSTVAHGGPPWVWPKGRGGPLREHAHLSCLHVFVRCNLGFLFRYHFP